MAGFIKFAGVDGECQDKDHKGWCDMVFFQYAGQRPVSGTGQKRRKADIHIEDATVRVDYDKAAPKLFEAFVKGKVFDKVEVHRVASYTDAGRATFQAFELGKVIVSSYDEGGDTDGDNVPEVQMSLNFEEFKVTYTETDKEGKAKGNVEMAWKVEEGES
jgi:type VI secretion system secreted protein Hcp